MKHAAISGNEQGRIIEVKDSIRSCLQEICEKRIET